VSSSPLPESMDDWPSNHYELFDVSEDCSERDLRRAYHRLIKIYRAEEYPVEFRKLNESYESLRARLKLEQEYRRQQSSDDRDSKADIDWFPNPSSSMVHPVKGGTSSNNATTDTRAYYQTAIEGDLETAISQIEAYGRKHPHDEDAVLRLFWLTKIDSGQPSFEVLENYLQQNGLSGRVFQVYLNELDRVPNAALRVSCRNLLLSSAGDPRLPGLSRLVWFLLYSRKSLKRIEQDLHDLKDSLVFDHPEQWKELVYQAIEFLALAGLPKSNQTFMNLREEARLCESTPSPEWIETRWEMVRSITCDAQIPGAIPENLLKLVRDSMLNDDWELRHRLELLILPWVSVPTLGLSTLDRLRDWSPTAIYLFHRTASHARRDDDVYYDREAAKMVRPVVLEFLKTSPAVNYESLRLEICHFCHYEDVSLELFLTAALECQQADQKSISTLRRSKCSMKTGHSKPSSLP